MIGNFAENKNSLSFEDGPAPEYGADLIARLKQKCPQVFLVCFRNKNKNVIVYQARTSPDGSKLLDPPVEGYWLILEPSYQDARKVQGILHDREELSFVDRTFAWGFECKRDNDTNATFAFRNRLETPMVLKCSPAGAQLFIAHENRRYNLRSLYIESSEEIHLFNLRDNVKELYLNAFDITQKPYRAKRVYLKNRTSDKLTIVDA